MGGGRALHRIIVFVAVGRPREIRGWAALYRSEGAELASEVVGFKTRRQGQ